MIPAFGKESCAANNVERDDDSKKNHPAPGANHRRREPESGAPRGCESLPLGPFSGVDFLPRPGFKIADESTY
jgi:hypothetical protein